MLPFPVRLLFAFSVGVLAPALAFAASAVSTTTVVTSSSPDLQAGSPVILTVLVSAADNTAVTPGRVILCDASNDTGSKPVMADCAVPLASAQTEAYQVSGSTPKNYGKAVITVYPALGNRKYEAVFLPNANYSMSAGYATVAVSGAAATATALTASGSSPNYSLTATVTATGTSSGGTGAVSFIDTTSNAALGSASLGGFALNSSLAGVSKPQLPGVFGCSVAAGDFNGDGVMDFAVGGSCQAPYPTNATTGLQILLGNGDGTSRAGLVSSAFDNNNVSGLTAGDFNNDGKMDLVATTFAYATPGSYTSTVQYGTYILLGDGSGRFSSASFAAGCGSQNLISADFDADGNLDFAMDCPASSTNPGPGSTQIYLGAGNGSFSKGASLSGGGSYLLDELATADFNGDGFSDLVIGSFVSTGQTGTWTYTATVFLNDGSGVLRATSTLTVPNGLYMAAGDFNGDGRADLAFTSSGGGSGGTQQSMFTMTPGNGDGTFATAVTSTNPVYVNSDGSALVAADFNGDGITDLGLISGNDTDVALAFGNGTFKVVAKVAQEATGIPDYYPGAVGDFNKDGIPDILVSSSDLQYASAVVVSFRTEQSVILKNINPLGSGSHAVIATYAGDSTTTSSTSSAVSVTATPAVTTLQLTAAPLKTIAGSQVMLTASLSPYSNGNLSTDGEVVIFKSGSQTVGTATLKAGAAFLDTTSLPVGTYNLTATFAGDSNFKGSASSMVAVTIIAGSVGISAPTLPAGGITLSTAGTTSVSLSISPPTGYTGSVAVSCKVNFKSTGTPMHAPVCSLNPSTILVVDGATAPTSLTLTTGSQNAKLGHLGRTSGLALAGLLMGFCFVPRRSWRGALLTVLCIMMLGFAAGCGGGGSGSSSTTTGGTAAGGTTSGSYTVTISVTAGSTSGAFDLPFFVQ